MDNKLQTITNNYNEIINNFIKESNYSKLYQETQDMQFRKLIDSFAILQAYQKYDYDTNMHSMILSILYNAFDIIFIHTDIIKTTLICSSNLIIPTNDIFENNALYTNKYNTYCINGQILTAQTIEKNTNYYMCLTIQLSNPNFNGITIIGNSSLINNIFGNTTKVNAIIHGNNVDCQLNIANIYEYCFNNEYGNVFTINGINNNQNTLIEINIPLIKYVATSLNDIQYNTLLLENKFIHSIMINIQENVYKYAINLPVEYELLNIINIKNDFEIIPSAKTSINGWYLTYENSKWFLNILDCKESTYYINMTCYNKLVYTSNLKPLQYKPCQIQYTYVVERMNLMYKNYITKLIMLINSFSTHNFKGVFELIKLYDNYNNLKYELNSQYMLTNKFINNICVTVSGLCIDILCNNKNAAFKWAINNALQSYKDIVKIIWR